LNEYQKLYKETLNQKEMLNVYIYDRTGDFSKYVGVIASPGIPINWRFELTSQRKELEEARKQELCDLVLAGNMNIQELEELTRFSSHTPFIILDGHNPQLRDLAKEKGLDVIDMANHNGEIAGQILGAYTRACEKRVKAVA
jgi:hypothetical protein